MTDASDSACRGKVTSPTMGERPGVCYTPTTSRQSECAMTKQAVSADVLMTLVRQRLDGIPMFSAALAANPAFGIRVGAPRRHDRDGAGRNWNIEAFETDFLYWPQCHAEFRYIVDRLRAHYDIG